MKKSSEKIEALIRHEILNAMTNLRFLVEGNEPFSPQTRADFLDTLAWASFLVAQPEGFLGLTPPVLLAPTSLQDLLEIVLLLQPQVQQKKLSGQSFVKEDLVLTDKNRSKEILSALLRFVLEKSDQVEWSLKKNRFTMLHHQGVLLLPHQNPSEVLSHSKMSDFERFLSCLLYQAPSVHLSIVSKKDLLEVNFKSS